MRASHLYFPSRPGFGPVRSLRQQLSRRAFSREPRVLPGVLEETTAFPRLQLHNHHSRYCLTRRETIVHPQILPGKVAVRHPTSIVIATMAGRFDLPIVWRLPRLETPADSNNFVLLQISSNGKRRPFDLMLLGTEGEAVYSVTCRSS